MSDRVQPGLLGGTGAVDSEENPTSTAHPVSLCTGSKWKVLSKWDMESRSAIKYLQESEIGDLIDDLERLRAIARFRLTFVPPIFPCRPWTGTLHTNCDYRLYFVIDSYRDLQYVIYFPEDNPSTVHIFRPTSLDGHAHLFYNQIVNATWLAAFYGYYDVLRKFTRHFDHSEEFIRILRRNKEEKTLKIVDGWFWNFHHWLVTVGVVI